MEHTSEMETVLLRFLPWNKARVPCLVQILQSIFCTRTGNLTQIAAGFQTKAKEASAYRRVCRFFSEFSFDPSAIVPLILKLFSFKGKYTLIMDRTNWKWGKSPINLLVVSVAYLGIGIPIFWIVLDREGNSSVKDRTTLLKRVVKRFGIDRIEAFVADREFVGKEWFDFLSEQNIPFVIRVKKNFLAEGICSDSPRPLETLCKQVDQNRKLENFPVRLWGRELYISVKRGKRSKDPIIVASNREFKKPLAIYKRRWEIEILFGCLKKRGFRMEDTRLIDGNKIEKLMFVLAIAFCWSYRAGEIKTRKIPTEIKSHGRKAKSIFREGVDLIRRALFRVREGIEDLRQLLLCFHRLESGSYVF